MNLSFFKKLTKHQKIAVSTGAAILVILALFLLLITVPAAYKPKKPVNDNQVSPYLTHYLAPDFYNNLQLDEPFELIVEQDGLNDIISRGNWPVDTGSVIIDQPFITFDNEQIKLMATVNFGLLPMVATIRAIPVIDPDTGLLSANLDSINAGKVNITLLARNVAYKLIQEEIKTIEASSKYTQHQKDIKIKLWNQCSQALLDNEPIEPVFTVPKSKTIRLSDIKLTEKKLKLYFVPQPHQQKISQQ